MTGGKKLVHTSGETFSWVEDCWGWHEFLVEGDGFVDRIRGDFGMTKPVAKAGKRAYAQSKKNRFIVVGSQVYGGGECDTLDCDCVDL